MPAEGPGAEFVSAACKAAREDSPGVAGGDALATGYATAEPQACKQARDSVSGARRAAHLHSALPFAFICGSAASMAASAGLGCQARRLVRDELHFLEVRHLLFVSYR